MKHQRTHEIESWDPESDRQEFLSDVIRGLTGEKKTLPSKYIYDRRGSELFDEICELEEYYPTRTELAIMRRHVEEMVAVIGPRCLLIEYGSGSSLKTKLLLDHLQNPAAYVPVDISRDYLLGTAESLCRDYPNVEILPVCADFTEPFELPRSPNPCRRRVVYFPGSTIGNFTPREAADLLLGIATLTEGGGLLIGVDLKKDRATLEAAYNDARGVTAAFNLNVLERINNELGAGIEIDDFEHKAFYDEDKGRVEMHLVSRKSQIVRIGDRKISFDVGESIHTENSHKYSLDGFRGIAEATGFEVCHVWRDDNDYFSVQYLEAAR